MSDKNNGWPLITQIFQQAKPSEGGGFATAVKWITIGALFLFTLRVIGSLFS